jgi:DnaK suppressor protein
MPTKKFNAKELSEFRGVLERARAMLAGDLSQLHEEALGGNSGQDSSEPRATDTSDSYYQEFNLELLERDESTLREVIDAIDRVDAGTFGQCEGCGSPIARERLRAVPHARYCIACQREAERGAL